MSNDTSSTLALYPSPSATGALQSVDGTLTNNSFLGVHGQDDEDAISLVGARLEISTLGEHEQDFCRCLKCTRNGDIPLLDNYAYLDVSTRQPSDVPHVLEGHVWVSHCHPLPPSHSQSIGGNKECRKLMMAASLCAFFMVVELVGGYFAHSLAIMSDAAHLLSDLASFGVSLAAIWLSKKRPTQRLSFGYHRAQVLGAVASVFLIWTLTGVLVYLAVERIKTMDFEIESNTMLIVSGCGVAVNLVMGLILMGNCNPGATGMSAHGHSHGDRSHGHSHMNISVKAALVHVAGDLLQSIGVLVAAFIIHFYPAYKVADPVCTLLFSVLVMATTFGVMRDCVNVLMEAVPQNIQFALVKEALLKISGVQMVHSLHIWSLTLDRIALSAHLAIDRSFDSETVLRSAEKMLRKDYEVSFTTIQVEAYDNLVMSNCDLCQEPCV